MSDLFETDQTLAGLVEAAAQAVEDGHRDKRQRTDDFGPMSGEESVDNLPDDGAQEDDQHGDEALNNEQQNEDPPNGEASNDSQSSDSHHTDSPNTAVLFREVGENARKYSRPPMAIMFQNLELVPENFLKLQNDAKTYMLDPAHTDRRDVIGERRQHGGQDLARIRLFNITEAYLNGGAGERFFGHSAITPGYVRTLFWPENSPEIIRQMMPLLRKLVSNERQRLYAAENRKEKARKAELYTLPDPPVPEPPPTIDLTSPVRPRFYDLPDLPDSTRLIVNIVRIDERGEFKRLVPRFGLNPDICTSVAAMFHEITIKLAEMRPTHPVLLDVNLTVRCAIKAWTQDGLVDIETDADWLVALLTAEGTEWMDGEVRILVIV